MKRIVKMFAVPVMTAGLIFIWTTFPVFADPPSPFIFAVTADMRFFSGSNPDYDNSNYFRGALEALQNIGGSAFMLSPGDIDPPGDVKWTIDQVLGAIYTWYPVVGNHELPGAGSEPSYGANMDWLRAYDYGTVNSGPSGCPETTYSFDFENAHFVVLNEYCDTGGDDVTDGDISNHLYDWLDADLSATTKEHIFVFGHEPAFPRPDADNGRICHEGDSLDAHPTHRDWFWQLLKDKRVVAYCCGHTHNYSTYFFDGVWQVDAGHARGEGDTGSASTILMIHVDGNTVTFDAYRDIHDFDDDGYYDYDYDDIIHSGMLYNGCKNADRDGDGDVDGNDLAVFINNGPHDERGLSAFAAEFGRMVPYNLRAREKITLHFCISPSAYLWPIPHSQNSRNSSLFLWFSFGRIP